MQAIPKILVGFGTKVLPGAFLVAFASYCILLASWLCGL